MFFGDVPSAQARGCILAHSLLVGKLRIRKGEVLGEELIRDLLANNVNTVTVARLEPGEIHEDNAASQLAEALCGPGVYSSDARTGRVNVFAAETGLLEINRELILASNNASHAITFATMAENQWVPKGKLVATAKIIPFAVAGSDLQSAIKAGTSSTVPALQIHLPAPHRAHLVQTKLEGTSGRVLEKTVRVCDERLVKRRAELVTTATCAHTAADLAIALEALTASASYRDGDWILIAGASAISDSNDVIPAGVRQLGGVIERFGIPVDPGNLLMIGKLQGHRVIGLPGCARSPKHNGFDQFLDRMSCNLPIDDEWINSLAVGGLLNEIPERPQQRSKLTSTTGQQSDKTTPAPNIAAVILAAGRSRRFGDNNKLLAMWQGKPILQHTLDNIASSQVDELLLITGYESELLHTTLPLLQQLEQTGNGNGNTGKIGENRKPLTTVYNPDYGDGMATSLRCAISFISDRNIADNITSNGTSSSAATPQTPEAQARPCVEAVLVCLGDMPRVSANTINLLIKAWQADPDASAFVPVHGGKQGNPVIMTSGLFDSLLSLNGDSGARKLLQASPAIVTEVMVNDSAILLDVDTTEELESLEPKA